jgi:large subunit ribosomal protein L2
MVVKNMQLSSSSAIQKISKLSSFRRLKTQTKGSKYGNGRNHSGQITVWHRGGGHKRAYRSIGWSLQGVVQGLEYDPNRTSKILRIFQPDTHSHRYILEVKNLGVGNLVRSFAHAKLDLGHQNHLQNLLQGSILHNLGKKKGNLGQYLRAPGTYGQLINHQKIYTRIKLRSGVHRLFLKSATATLGSVGSENWKLIEVGSAGRSRHLGRRPHVRGVAINPIDHPHGGGEGRTSGGRPSVTPWGKPTKGQPTKKRFSPLEIAPNKK